MKKWGQKERERERADAKGLPCARAGSLRNTKENGLGGFSGARDGGQRLPFLQPIARAGAEKGSVTGLRAHLGALLLAHGEKTKLRHWPWAQRAPMRARTESPWRAVGQRTRKARSANRNTKKPYTNGGKMSQAAPALDAQQPKGRPRYKGKKKETESKSTKPRRSPARFLSLSLCLCVCA
jgi:hypothetical protein